MINAWNLIWMIPLAASVGFILAAVLNAGREN